MAEGSDTKNGGAKAGGSMLVPALVVVNLLVSGATLALHARGAGSAEGREPRKESPQPAENAGKPSADRPAPGPSAKLSDFVVHLRDVETDRYARLSFEIEVATAEDNAKLGAFIPRIRDAFIAYLSDRTLAELRGGDAIGRTKSALEERLKALAPGVAVRGLYVTDLVIQ